MSSSIDEIFSLLDSEVENRKKMELRDRFAMAALTGLLADSNLDTDENSFAKLAYTYADAMLKAREEKKVSPDAE